MKGAQAGVLLVVIVLFASISALVVTTTFDREVPSVQRETTEALADVRTSISRGVLDWTSDTSAHLACNGVYELDESHFLDSLRPYVEDRISQGDTQSEDDIEITTGTLTNLTFDGLTGFTITLEDGSVIYDDGNIYSENTHAQEFFFSNRFPLAMNVVQDWLACDAGNLSSHLASTFGNECFFGKMDSSYPGGCPLDPKMDITDTEREYMLSLGITPTKVAQGVANAVGELNQYFAGTNSCNAEPLQEDAGISCRFEVFDLNIEQEFTPWNSSRVVVLEEVGRPVTTWDLHNMGQEYGYPLEYEEYIDSSERIYALPMKSTLHGYSDNDLQCNQEPERIPVQDAPGIGGGPEYEPSYDMGLPLDQSGYDPLLAHPALYVNTTRGAHFQVGITCTDNRVSLLGQQLEYSFSFTHGVKQHCGPDLMENGAFMCGGCGLKPGLDFSQCREFRVPNCRKAVEECRNSLVWEESVSEGSEYDWQGSVQATIDEYPELADYIDSTCAVERVYDEEQEAWVNSCPGAQTTVCCRVPGYQEDCDPATSFDNPECYYSQTEYKELCSEPISCGPSSCMNYKCDTDINECVEDEPLPAGSECPGDCSACDGEGNCVNPHESQEGRTCGPDPNSITAQCQTGTCTEEGCDVININEGGGCALNWGASPQCATGQCQDGQCARVPANEGQSCSGTPPTGCTADYSCSSGYCQQEPGSLDCGDGGGSCEPPCSIVDGSCVC